jgi:serine/threonine protein kinase/formylglycine-generating enzyme required for sulfatase activity
MADLIGQVINQKYEIVELLDEGGMAVVYKAYDIRLNRTVALKIIPKEKFNKEQLEEILQRFDQEAKALAQLSHPNIVPILDYGEWDGSPYLVLEFLSGGTLRKWMEPEPLPWQVAINVILPIMDALMYCHKHGILHRDIKPSNILFREEDTPVLTDFGIAKLLGIVGNPPKTLTGGFVGTPGYMAPEQQNNSNHTQLDVRMDIYQLGTVLYEAITGRRPSDLANVVETIPSAKTYAPNLPVVFDKIILKALEVQPTDRYQSMEEFKAALQNALNNHPLSSEIQGQIPSKTFVKLSKTSDTKSRPLPIFLCYAWSDEENVVNLGRVLRQDGMRTRPDKKNSKPGNTNPGTNWKDKLFKEIQKSEALVVCLTNNSATRGRKLKPEIKLAMEMAHARSIPIIHVRLHDCIVPPGLSAIDQVDLFEEVGYPKLRGLLAERAEKLGFALPLMGGFYIQPTIIVEKPSLLRYAVAAVILLTVIVTSLFIYSLSQSSPPSATPTDTVAATETHSYATPINSPGVTAFPREITDLRGTEMLLVTSGEFAMGYNFEEAVEECKRYNSHCSLELFKKAGPAKPVSLKAFYIDKYEVSNNDYQKCVNEKICQPPEKTISNTRTEYFGAPKYGLYPVIYVDWNMAKTYCEKWREARLPTEAEWEKAARGEDGNLFPWGNTVVNGGANFCDKNCPIGTANINLVDSYRDTAPVTAFTNGKSPYKLFNMAGNVWEWISSLYKDYPYDPNDGREDQQAPGVRVVRGGSWRDDIGSIFAITRNGYDPSVANDSIGFRCAKSP